MSKNSLKLGVISGAAGLSLLAGGLFFGSSLVSAQEPTPTPQSDSQMPPQDSQKPRDGMHNGAGCDKDRNGEQDGSSSSDSGTSFRAGRAPFRQ